MKSRSNQQLLGNNLSVEELNSDCLPIVTNNDVDRYYSWDGTKLTPEAAAYPCGLVAKSYFNDTIAIKKEDGTAVDINKNGIAWQSDIDNKFKNIPESEGDWKKIQWTDVTNGKFIFSNLIPFLLNRGIHRLDENSWST